MPVTIRDVAKKLNISTYTVSRALNGYSDVSAETRERVIFTAQEMGYTPSSAARQLRLQRANIIGYIIPASGPHFTDPFFSNFIAGLGDEAASHKLDLMVSLAPPDSTAEEQIYERWIQGHLIDGLVLSRMRLDDWRVKYLHHHSFPFVGHGQTALNVEFPFIDVDSCRGFTLLVRHMFERGHRRIAYVGAPAAYTLQADRFTGYQVGLTAVGIPFDPTLVAEGDFTRNGGYQAAQNLLSMPNPPTAIIGVTDMTAIGVMRAARERNLVVGRDLAVAGYDGMEDSENSDPPLTTLKQPVYEAARRLVEMLVERIAGKTITISHDILQPELIVRASSGI